MKHGVSTYSFAKYLQRGEMTLEQVIQKAAELGFEGIEMANITEGWLCKTPDIESLKKTAEECGIEICSWAMAANYASDNVEEEIARIKGEIDKADYLGCKVVRTDICAEGTPDRYADQIINAIREMADYCQKKGITLVTENHGCCFCRPERLEELCRRVNHPNFGLLCDFANYAISDVDAVSAIGQIRTLVRHVHMKDCHLLSGDRIYPGEGWYVTIGGNYWRCAITGQGNIPYFECMKVLTSIGYDGWLIQEFEGIEEPVYAVSQGMKYAKRLLKAVDEYGTRKEGM